MIASVANTAPTVRPRADETAAKQRLDAAKQAQAQQATAAATAASTEESAAVVSISKQGAEQATAKAAPPQAAAAAAAEESTPKSNKPALAYEAADTDQDGKISAFEQQSYGFRHPAALKAYAELAAATAPKDEAAAASGAVTGKPTEAPGPV